MRYPYGISVDIFDRDDAVIGNAFIPERLVYHHVPFTGSERILRSMGILGATDTYGNMHRLLSTFADDVHVSFVQWLETAHNQGITFVILHLNHLISMIFGHSKQAN